MMKVLYLNPVFLEYKLAFCKEMNRLLEGNFYVVYSPNRYKLLKKESLCEKIKAELGDNAIPLTHDYLFDTHSKRFNEMPDIEKGKRIPFTFGLLKQIRKVKPDVLISEGFFQWTPQALLYGRLNRIPVYVEYERTLYTERNTKKIITRQRQLFDKYLTGYIVNGQETKKYLESIGVKPEKIHVGGMSADSAELVNTVQAMPQTEKEQFRAQYQKEDGLVYLFSGRVSVLKGADLLLSAWETHIQTYPKDKLILIGYGDKSEEMKQKYAQEPSVFLEGMVKYDTVYKYYATADVFILPTLIDNWSLVVPEAMACGLPVSTSIYNGCHAELVRRDENGCVFDPYKPEEIVTALDYFHHHDLTQMGKRSVEIEKNFNTGNVCSRVYKALAREKKKERT